MDAEFGPFKTCDGGYYCGHVRNAYAELRTRPRYVWTICAAIALITSKSLLIDLGLQYPVNLSLLQLAAAASLCATSQLVQPTRSVPSLRWPTRLEWVFLLLVAIPMALSTILTLQAIVHYPNVVTLPMLATIALFTELTISLVTSRSFPTPIECFRIVVVGLSCCGILYYEYRLMVKGLLASIIAVLLAGFSKAFQTIVADNVPEAINHSRWISMMYYSSAFVIAGVWCWFGEGSIFEMLSGQRASVLLINVPCAAVALAGGKSMLLPMSGFGPREGHINREQTRAVETVMVTALTGITGFLSTLLVRRSYTTSSQIFWFFVAVIVIAGNSTHHYKNPSSKDNQRGYAPVSAESDLKNTDSKGTAPGISAAQSDTSRAAAGRGHRNFVITFLAFGLTISSFWIAFPVLNFTESIYPTITTSKLILDNTYVPNVKTEVVISMYKEPIADVVRLVSSLRQVATLSAARIHIYIKDADANVENVQQLTKADEVTVLPNIGREGETYLYHITDQWDSLARHTVFLQADIHNPREFYPRVRDYFDPTRTGMLSLGFSGHTCNCNECEDAFDWQDTTQLIPQTYRRIYNSSEECTDVLLSYKGQFIVSAKRIRAIDKSIYADLRDAFVNEDSWAHQQEYLQGRKDSMSQPQLGYTMERMWNLLFQCSSMDVAWKCPTLISGTRQGGGPEDCQCFDPKAKSIDSET